MHPAIVRVEWVIVLCAAELNLIHLLRYKNVRHEHMVCGGRRKY